MSMATPDGDLCVGRGGADYEWAGQKVVGVVSTRPKVFGEGGYRRWEEVVIYVLEQ